MRTATDPGTTVTARQTRPAARSSDVGMRDDGAP